MHRITDETTQRQAEIDKEKDAQVNDLNQLLLQQQKEQRELNRKAKEAERALRHLQLKRTKEQSQSITPEEIQRMIEEGICCTPQGVYPASLTPSQYPSARIERHDGLAQVAPSATG